MNIIPPSSDHEDDGIIQTYDFSLPESSEIVPPTPEQHRISLALREKYLRDLERSKQIRQQQSKPHPSADSSASGPTSGS